MILEKLKYINHRGEVFDFAAEGIWTELSDLHDYAWSFSTRNRRIAELYRDITAHKLPVTIVCRTENEGINVRNRLFETVEKDILAGQYGRLVLGDYYCRCYITGSQKSDYLISRRHMRATLTVTTDLPVWIKETPFRFLTDRQSSVRSQDFAHDYPFDWHNSMNSDWLANPNFVSSNFRLIMHGPVANPAVFINGHEYRVNCTIGADEYLTVDSSLKTVTLTHIDGTQSNRFADRSRDQYIFQPIPPGRSAVLWDKSFIIDIILLEERSEPRWT
jgi:hypothetical protein